MATDEEVEEQFEELVRYIAEGLLDTDDFDVNIKQYEGQINIDLHAPKHLRGRVIGRGGRIARSIRNLLDAAAIDTHRRPNLDITD